MGANVKTPSPDSVADAAEAVAQAVAAFAVSPACYVSDRSSMEASARFWAQFAAALREGPCEPG